jgi:hypothetical protein
MDLGLDLLFMVGFGAVLIVGNWGAKRMPAELRRRLRRPFLAVLILILVGATAFYIWSFATYRVDPNENLQRVIQDGQSRLNPTHPQDAAYPAGRAGHGGLLLSSDRR